MKKKCIKVNLPPQKHLVMKAAMVYLTLGICEKNWIAFFEAWEF